jgi:ATP-dependent helicase HrpA
MVHVPTVPTFERFPGRPEGGRIVVIAPTRASCETIEIGVGLTGVETVLQREHGEEVRRLAASGHGFGIVAGTGTGKTLAIRPIAEELVGTPIRAGVVNREREATPETPTWNVVIVTTGIARRWLQDGLITREDTLVIDEIHQTSAELELCLALGKRAGCRFIWLSATVDPTFYSKYLDSAEVIQSSAFDPARAADVRVVPGEDPLQFLNDRFLRRIAGAGRGVAIFVPTRAETERIAVSVAERWPKLTVAFYHGGEPISKLRPFLDEDPPHPYLLAMTAAGQSALNIRGLDTVIIEDARFTTLVRRGKGVLTRLTLGANEILQMAGRVHGRVEGGEVWILSERNIDFATLKPVEPEFQLAGDPERVAMTCADIGVRADELDLPVPLDRTAYRRAVEMLERRGLIRDGRLTPYGREVEVLPVDRPWGELLVKAPEHLIPLVATCAAVESLHRMTRAERYIKPYVVPGSDHLSAYNLYAEALRETGSMGSVWGLPRHVFDAEALAEWAEERGVLVRSIEDGALALASIFRGVERPLPRELPKLNTHLTEEWRRLLAEVMPFDLVMDGETSWGEEVGVSPSSVCDRWGAVTGTLRYFSDRFGRARGSIEGTEIPFKMVWENADTGPGEIAYNPSYPRSPLRLRTARTYHGFELESDEKPIDAFPEGLEEEARRALADAMAAGAAYHRDVKANRAVIRELREVHRRSGGTTPEITETLLTRHFLDRLREVRFHSEFQETDLKLDPNAFVPIEERRRWLELPDTIELAGDEYPLDYAFEGETAVVRARVPAKLIPQLSERKLPELDRPLHWTVIRGKRNAIRASSLEEAKAILEGRAPEPEADDPTGAPVQQGPKGRDSRGRPVRGPQRESGGRSGGRSGERQGRSGPRNAGSKDGGSGRGTGPGPSGGRRDEEGKESGAADASRRRRGRSGGGRRGGPRPPRGR